MWYWRFSCLEDAEEGIIQVFVTADLNFQPWLLSFFPATVVKVPIYRCPTFSFSAYYAWSPTLGCLSRDLTSPLSLFLGPFLAATTFKFFRHCSPSVQTTARWFSVLLWIFRLFTLNMDLLNKNPASKKSFLWRLLKKIQNWLFFLLFWSQNF